MGGISLAITLRILISQTVQEIPPEQSEYIYAINRSFSQSIKRLIDTLNSLGNPTESHRISIPRRDRLPSTDPERRELANEG